MNFENLLLFLDKNFKEIRNETSEINKEINNIKIILAKQHSTLEEHTRRSLANEEAVEILKQEIKPIQSHIYGVNAIAKSIAFVAVIAGLLVSIIKIVEFFQ